MSDVPSDLRYTKTHEWLRLEEDNVATIGITDHAQHLLGDMVFVELPEVGSEIRAGDEAGVVESVKAASDFYAPISGEVLAVNEELIESPALVNTDPYGAGWLVQVRINDSDEIDELLDADEYSQEFGDDEDEA